MDVQVEALKVGAFHQDVIHSSNTASRSSRLKKKLSLDEFQLEGVILCLHYINLKNKLGGSS